MSWFCISEAEGKTWPAGILNWHRCKDCREWDPRIIIDFWSIRLCLKGACGETVLYGKLMTRLKGCQDRYGCHKRSNALKGQPPSPQLSSPQEVRGPGIAWKCPSNRDFVWVFVFCLSPPPLCLPVDYVLLIEWALCFCLTKLRAQPIKAKERAGNIAVL